MMKTGKQPGPRQRYVVDSQQKQTKYKVLLISDEPHVTTRTTWLAACELDASGSNQTKPSNLSEKGTKS